MTIIARALPSHADDALAGMSAEALIELMLVDEDRVPKNVIDHCAARGEPMVECVRAAAEGERCWRDDVASGEWWLLLHAAMILGKMASESAGLLLVRLMRRMSVEDDRSLQDWLAGYWPALFANKPPPVIGTVRELAEDRSLDWYIRCQATDVVVDAGLRAGHQPLELALDWLAACVADEADDRDFRLGAANTLLDLPRARHHGLLDELAVRQDDGILHFSREDVEDNFARARDEPAWRRRGQAWRFYEPGAIAARQDRWEEEAARGDNFIDPDDERFGEISLPYVRPGEKVGRNDPCPCGSGKKYKKCCLRVDPA